MLLVDDVRLTRDCLLQRLHDCCPDLSFHAVDSTAALTAGEVMPDLVVFNTHRTAITDLDRSQMEAIRSGGIHAIAIVDRGDFTQAIEGLSEGLYGVFSCEDDVELLVAAIRLVLAGGRFVPPNRRNRA